MEFKIGKDELLRGLYLASGIADRKSTLPILANALIRTIGRDRLLIGATDLTVTAIAHLDAKVETEGGITVTARQLYEIAKGLPGDDVRVRRTDQNWVEIRAGKAEFKVVAMADREYPKLPTVEEAETVKVDCATLREMIAKTIFSVSTDETRQHLSGVLFESDGAQARMVSTDGHRLSSVGRSMPGGPRLGAGGVLIPRKGLLEIRRAIETREAPCEIGIHQKHFIVRADDVVLSVKLLDGQFPPYDQVIPKGHERTVIVGRTALLDAMRRVAIIASDKTWGVRLALEKGKLRVESDNPDLGTAREEIDVTYKGTPVQLGLNARYFIELLSEMGTPDVKLELAGELDPAVLRPADEKDDYVGVVMPMRI